ncbi:relaxase/mobilization nuclease domain-containing protein [Lentzea californiensis]|uniref:relaxase/mobilization nuclease domain-containing protein n=1 Tax=Lentzea californiensis TaxID=438851 RepID=UPI002164626A|nr:relaxase/mobilization nuclease domain-containing protein [Lentzea californiensis]MCR3748798.1 Relaxase/Mobilization nuclease domain-containing protein [Lentzea californiensis]
MIRKVTRGWNVYGLIRYLMGPGSTEQSAHTDQHVFATWDGRPEVHQPEQLGPDRFDLGALVAALRAPAALAGVPKRRPREDGWPGTVSRVPKGPVWQCSLRNHPADPLLTDEQWAEVVADVLHRTGIAERDDPGSCRWVAIRHAPDHVHIAAVLVRQDTGELVHPHRNYDFRRVKEACNAAEERYRLTSTGAADRTATPRPTRAEKEKASRLHDAGQRQTDVAIRVRLRRQVSSAAAAARNWDEFLDYLALANATVRVRQGHHGRILGYSVTDASDPACRTASGDPLYFAGGKLGPDLTYSKLMSRWRSVETTVPASVQGIVDEVVLPARERMRHRGPLNKTEFGQEALQGIAHATGDMLLALVVVADAGRAPLLIDAWETYARAGRVPDQILPRRWAAVSRDLRTAANQLIRAGMRNPASQRATPGQFIALLIAVAALVAEIAAWHEAHQRHVAARHARATHGMLVQIAAGQTNHMESSVLASPIAATSKLRRELAKRPPIRALPSHRSAYPKSGRAH